ncbi:MAG TPA: prolyl oligopeptidase family serine peptidase [Candidatus Sulfotelmatobacter sp.]|nr:prolyl oligopeptidase family serine peptidase [Candidatus Sulfotelmatobacter sp.]
MPKLMEPPPYTPVEAVTEILHGVAVTDPYRWLEDQESPRTRAWIAAQTQFARSYLDAIPGRKQIRKRIRELLDIETYDSILKAGNRYFFRKRRPGQEQPSTYFREGLEGQDQLLVDPGMRGTGRHTAVKPLHVSPDGRLLLYEVKEGGERTGAFELIGIESRKTLPDALPRGYLRGFAFAPDSLGFYYSHEPAGTISSDRRAVYHHELGTSFRNDEEIFVAGEDNRVRLHIVAGKHQIGFLVCRYLDTTFTDFYLWRFAEQTAEPVMRNAGYVFGPVLLDDGRILAITNSGSPNLRIVEVHPRNGTDPTFTDVIPPSDVPIQNWVVAGEQLVASYLRGRKTEIEIFDLWGNRLHQLPSEDGDTLRILGASEAGDEIFLERESFTQPIQLYTYSAKETQLRLWARREVPFESSSFTHVQVWFPAEDGARIPMFLVGKRDVLERPSQPMIMTSYGGFGVSMTPQFSVFVAFLMERGCLFALPNIRGGSEFGVEWHDSAKRRNRQVAFSDFLSATEWLVETGRTEPRKIAIFGGSNSGLLVAAAMTQRPDLFGAVVCIVPMLDMVRYHLFDGAYVWKDEFGTADDPEDFPVLFNYSPYHRVRDGWKYPATLIVSGDSDQNCNPLHARKMTARLQAASSSDAPILLAYSHERGHSPVLPLSERIDALTDRMAFLCDQLELSV